MKLDPCCEKGIFVGYDKQSPSYLIYFLEMTAIKKVKCVKFTDSYDNSPQTKQENMQNCWTILALHMMNNQKITSTPKGKSK